MDDWVSAREFRDAVEAAGEFSSMLATICARAGAGIVKTKAARIVLHAKRGQQIFDGAVLPIGFWWAGGRSPMELNWGSGDFSCHYAEKASRWNSVGISLLVAPPSGVADLRVQAFGVQFERSGAAELCPSLAPQPEPVGTQLSQSDEGRFYAALAAIGGQWTEPAANDALNGLFPGRVLPRARLRAGLKAAGLSQEGPGRPTNAPKSRSAE